MERIPFGVRQLDTIVNGGAPTGSVVLLAGEAGAGSREFVHTSALLNGLGTVGDDLYDLYYGEPGAEATQADAVHYISFTDSEAELAEEMRLAMDDDVVDRGLDLVEFHDMSERYFHVSPVPREWYAEKTRTITDLRQRSDREDLLGALGSTLSDVAPGNLVVIDSLSDLIATRTEEVDWADINFLVKGLQKAAHEWDGLILLHLNHETLTPTEFGQLSEAVDGTMHFEWESGGSTRARTLVVKQFRGVLSQIEDEDIVRFETDIGDAGFDISDVRKIR
ncbi:RecA-superfamily ATPase, KaiC/GvpD/RAD55 family [Halomicrobium zhouii]|uniref:RecA-superfamily ATPase, KaiC/GvpD/RAD55 family n=1 Tax=Halomicrobium zhouii TaxID=767519 RepID=A0A1I6KMQ2_9EURY|nr:HTR-like protein [Halomicrobium zhouii]SFR92533.1 RecA-superfamily ATPase, KaiC/GvpD/RAD55 family [Halomicrobium zhouii]